MQNHRKTLHIEVKEFCLAEKFFDVTLASNIDNKTVPAHSLVLAAYSTYFREECMNSRQLGNPFVIHLDAKSDIIRNLVLYCYTGVAIIEEDNVIELLKAALLFKFAVVVKECEKFIINHLSLLSCLGVVAYAEEREYKGLLEQAEVYLFDNFVLISETEEFLHLSLEELQNILAKNRKACSEEQLFNGVLNWLEHNENAEEQYLPKLLPKIRIKSLDTKFVLNKLDLIQLSAEALKETQELLMAAHIAETTALEEPKKAGLELIAEYIGEFEHAIVVIGCYPRIEDDDLLAQSLCSAFLNIYGSEFKAWLPMGMLKEPIFDFGAVCVNNVLLLIGGIFDGEPTNCVGRVVLVPCSYKPLTYMNAKRVCPAAAVMNNCIYAIGGAGALKHDMNTVERLDLSSGKWEYVAPLNEARQGAGVAVLDGVLYVIGGSFCGRALRTVERYDAAANAWIYCKPMIKERRRPGVAAFKEVIYAVGGKDSNGDHRSVECYDPLKDEWTKVRDLKAARSGLSCVSFEDRLYAIGGRSNGTVETYDPDVDEWEMDSILNQIGLSCFAFQTHNF